MPRSKIKNRRKQHSLKMKKNRRADRKKAEARAKKS